MLKKHVTVCNIAAMPMTIHVAVMFTYVTSHRATYSGMHYEKLFPSSNLYSYSKFRKFSFLLEFWINENWKNLSQPFPFRTNRAAQVKSEPELQANANPLTVCKWNAQLETFSTARALQNIINYFQIMFNGTFPLGEMRQSSEKNKTKYALCCRGCK